MNNLTDGFPLIIIKEKCSCVWSSRWNSNSYSGKFVLPVCISFINGLLSLCSLQGVLLGLFLVPVFYKSILRIWLYFTTLGKQRSQEVEERYNRGIGSAIVFYASLLVMLAILVPAWMYFVQDFHMHPLLW